MKRLIAAFYIAAAPLCSSIDPGSCRPHVDEAPFGQDKPQLHIAAEVVLSSCSWCGKSPEGK